MTLVMSSSLLHSESVIICIPSLILSQFLDISYFLKKSFVLSISLFVIILFQVYNSFSSSVNVMFYLSVRLLFIVLAYNQAKNKSSIY